MVKVSLMVLVLLSTMAIVYVISASEIAIAQPITESAGGMNVTGNLVPAISHQYSCKEYIPIARYSENNYSQNDQKAKTKRTS